VLDATRFGSACAQVYYEEIATPEEFGPTDDENCLTLNIWTPDLDDERRPVMVWITERQLDQATRALRQSRLNGDVVVSITIAQIFGFVDISVLGGDATTEARTTASAIRSGCAGLPEHRSS
jgi:hypothetical protein